MDTIRNLVINNYSQLTESERFIAKKILNNLNIININTIEELSTFCSVSKSTVIRFTKKLGLEGFSELKSLLKLNKKSFQEIDKVFIDRVCDNDIQIINYYRNYDFSPIIKLIEQSPIIYAYGTGMFQRSFSKELQRLFMHAGIWVRLISDEGEFEVTLNLMKEKDSIFIISSGGENEFLDDKYDLLKIKGIDIISFTNSANNSLAFASNYNISTELNKENFYNQFYFDNIVTMYIPLKILFAEYVDYQVNRYEENI